MPDSNGADAAWLVAAERDLANQIAMAMLHRFIEAAGGEIKVSLAELPAEVPLHTRIANGIAIVRALPPPQQSRKPRLIAVAAELASKSR